MELEANLLKSRNSTENITNSMSKNKTCACQKNLNEVRSKKSGEKYLLPVSQSPRVEVLKYPRECDRDKYTAAVKDVTGVQAG